MNTYILRAPDYVRTDLVEEDYDVVYAETQEKARNQANPGSGLPTDPEDWVIIRVFKGEAELLDD